MKIVSVIGSTRAKPTTSESIITYISDGLGSEISVEMVRAHKIFNNSSKFDVFIKNLYACDLFIICSPLYLDGLPYPLTALLERIYDKTEKSKLHHKRFIAIIHSGYPEPPHRECALNICENFAQQLKMKWQGGIGFGGTSPIGGKNLNNMGFYTRFIKKSLDLVIKAIDLNENIPEKAISLSRKFPIPLPKRIIIGLINILMKKEAKTEGIEDLYIKPYDDL